MRNVVPFKFFALHKGNLVNQSTCIISFIPLAEYRNFFRIKDPSKGPVPNHSTTTNDTTILSRVCIEPYAGRFRTSMPPRETDRREIAREPDAVYYLLFRRIFLITRTGGAKKEPVESRVT